MNQGGAMGLSYNLLTEAWLPCIDQELQPKMMSILEVIEKAHTLKGIQADIPPTTGSLYLFLMALIRAIFKPADEDEWKTLWLSGNFPMDKVLSYADKWKNRLDLFDEQHPFYQDPKIGKRKKDLEKLKGQEVEPKGISGLLLHIASGSNPTLFNHSSDDKLNRYYPGEAAQILVMVNAYSLGGLTSASIGVDKNAKDSAFGRGILFMSKGRSLFHTLLLNLNPSNFSGRNWGGTDIPAWEQDDPYEIKEGIPKGFCDLLTWQSRRIKLLPEIEDGIISCKNCLVAPGTGLVETFTNPYYLIRYDKKGTEIKSRPLRFMIGRMLWRDSAAILDTKTKEADPPLAIKWFEFLRAQDIIYEKEIQLECFGMCTDPGKKKSFFYSQAAFSAPTVYLDEETLLSEIKIALGWVEDIRKGIYFTSTELAGYKLAPTQDLGEGKKPDPKEVANLIEHLDMEPAYWCALEPAFYQLLANLPTDKNALVKWQQAIKTAARNSLSLAAEMVGSDAAGLKARAKAEMKLAYELNKLPDLSKEE